MAVQEAYVQQPVDGTGKKVQTYEVLRTLADGSTVTVELQGVIAVDMRGNPVDWKAHETLLTEIRDLLQQLVEKD